MPIVHEGLRDIYVTETNICGIFSSSIPVKLVYRDQDITTLGDISYEKIAYLLIYGVFPDEDEYALFLNTLVTSRKKFPREIIGILEKINNKNKEIDSISLVRKGICLLSAWDHESNEKGTTSLTKKGIKLLAQLPLLTGIVYRIKTNKKPYFVSGGDSDKFPTAALINSMFQVDNLNKEKTTEALNASLWLHAEHGLNNSTFTLRNIISTGSDIYSAIIGALGSLKGPLHGGASVEVITLLRDLEEKNIILKEKIKEYIQNAYFDEGKKVSGFGHAVYKNGDPRAKILRKLVLNTIESSNATREIKRLFLIAENLEKIMLKIKPNKPLYPNVDYWASLLYYSIGIPAEMNVSMFATARVAGWVAHAKEQSENNVLYRPRALYKSVFEMNLGLSFPAFSESLINISPEISLLGEQKPAFLSKFNKPR
ncbi:citrate/2-methylcitrate synthase [Candidatus Woesearchaeota archaeon]|nr:citrate/2-methylcitrate synthase [Candidatus Woesearchaeota archaeon]